MTTPHRLVKLEEETFCHHFKELLICRITLCLIGCGTDQPAGWTGGGVWETLYSCDGQVCSEESRCLATAG